MMTVGKGDVLKQNVEEFAAERYTLYVFFFQAEDGIRDKLVTGVQTCPLPISGDPGDARDTGDRGGEGARAVDRAARGVGEVDVRMLVGDGPVAGAELAIHGAIRGGDDVGEIGRASCRERV